MGKNIKAIESWGGCDVDYEWQFGIAETLYKAKQSKQ